MIKNVRRSFRYVELNLQNSFGKRIFIQETIFQKNRKIQYLPVEYGIKKQLWIKNQVKLTEYLNQIYHEKTPFYFIVINFINKL